MRLPLCLVAALLLPCTALATPSQVVTDDIGRFWATYDAVRAEPDVERRSHSCRSATSIRAAPACMR